MDSTKRKERIMKRSLVTALILMMITGMVLFTTSCAKQTTQSQAETTSQPEAPVASEPPAETAEPIPAKPPAEEPAPAVIDTAIVDERIYFRYNSAALTDQAPPVLTGMVAYLRTNPGLSVTVQGHCDERGTEAYNMKLGAQRAESVKQYLVDQGIPAHRLATISYGKSRPVALGHDEASWAQNRRAEFEVN
jgi:peptidoglycan-associated lipoprotein